MEEYLKNHPAEVLHVLLKTKNNADILSECAPFTKDDSVLEQGNIYYLCENGTCKAPVMEFDQMNL